MLACFCSIKPPLAESKRKKRYNPNLRWPGDLPHDREHSRRCYYFLTSYYPREGDHLENRVPSYQPLRPLCAIATMSDHHLFPVFPVVVRVTAPVTRKMMKALDRSHRIHLGDALSPHCLLRSRSSQGCYCFRRIHHHRGHSGWYRSIRIRLRKGYCHSYQRIVVVGD